MDLLEQFNRSYHALPERVKGAVEYSLKKLPLHKTMNALPFVRKRVENELSKVFSHLPHPSQKLDRYSSYQELPDHGVPYDTLLTSLQQMADEERNEWSQGFVSGAVYHGGKEHVDFLNAVYEAYSQTNPLHSDVWPSMSKFESEIVSMTAKMLGASSQEDISGTVSSGGTESILLAMKTYRDFARQEHGIRHPEMIVPVTAHAAFDKASQYFGIKKVTIPVDDQFKAQVPAARKAITKNTIVIVGSAPAFPHGIIDPIPELSELAHQHKIGFHTDACLGGFILPFVKDLYLIPAFDFALRGVTSISCDTHKFGYASKGSSVVLYRGASLRRHQYFVASDWPGGLYCSPTLAGSRPGAILAQCWSSLVAMGKNGYRENARRIMTTASFIKKEIGKISPLRVLGDPLWVIAFTADGLNIYEILGAMQSKGWHLNGLHRPSCVHICVTLRHTQPGVAERFIADLKESVQAVAAKRSSSKEGMAPIYGMAATLPARGLVDEMLRRYLDFLYTRKA